MTTVAIVLDARQIACRKACAYLKGLIVGYARRNGMKWDGDPSRTSEFKLGFETERFGFPRFDEKVATYVHILYNRLRHDRPHLESVEADNEFIRWHIWERPLPTQAITGALDDLGFDVNELG